MARRRSLNRRWSRRSINSTGILNDDSNIVDDEDPLWWKKIGNKPNSIRPSGRFNMSESSSTAELNPNSALNDTEASGEWWDVLQKTSQDLVPKKIDKDNSKITPKKTIISNTSDSDTDDRMHEAKKRKVNLRRTRKSLGKNAFSQVLDSSEPAIESEPILSQSSHVTRTSFQSLDELPPRRTRQQSKNDSILSYNSNSSDTDKIHKRRPTLFKRPRGKISTTAFDDVLEGDESVIAPSQEVDIEKSSGKSNAINIRSSKRSHSAILKPINDQTSFSQDKSLNHSKDSITKSLNRRKKNGSLEHKSKNEAGQSALSSPVIGDSIRQSRKISRKKSTEHSDSTSSILNKGSNNDQSNSPILHFSPSTTGSSLELKSKKETSQTDLSNIVNTNRGKSNISDSYDESERIVSQPRLRFKKNDRKKSSTNPFDDIHSDSDKEDREISPKQKSTKQSALSSMDEYSRNDQNNTLTSHFPSSNRESISNKVSESREIARSNISIRDQSLSKRSKKNESDASLTTSISEELKIGNPSQRLMLQEASPHPADKMNVSSTANISHEILQDWESDDSGSSGIPEKTNSKDAHISDHSVSTEKNTETREPRTGTIESCSQSEHHMKSNSSNKEKRGQSEKISVEESPASEGKVIIVRRSRRRLSDTDNVEITVDPSVEKPSQEIEMSDEEIINNKSNRNRSRSMKISDTESSSNDEEIFKKKTISHRSASQNQTGGELEENNNKGLDSTKKSPKTPVRRSQRSLKKIPDTTRRSSTHNSKVNEKNTGAVDESDSGGEISRDPSAYELPDMNRSDSVTLSDSDDENEPLNAENTLENKTLTRTRTLSTGRSPEKKPSPAKNRSTIKNKYDTSKISIDNTSIEPSEPLPSTSGIRKVLPVRKSLINQSGRKSNKFSISSNQRSILNFLTPHSPRPVRHEPLPTEDEVHDFREKLKTVTIERDKQKELHKKEMEKELEEMRIKLASQKTSNVNKFQKKMILPKNSKSRTKVVDKAFIVNGKVYKQPKLPRPKHWATDRLYKYLWKIMEPKHKLETRIRSEKFIIELSNVVTIVTRRKKYENYKEEVDTLMKRMAHLGIIKTRNDFYHFCYDFLPYEFRAKVTPILLPGNKHTIPFDPAIIDIPLLGG